MFGATRQGGPLENFDQNYQDTVVKLWLTQDEDRRFWLHGKEPIIALIDEGKGRRGVFEQVGDPLRVPASFCQFGVQRLMGHRLELPQILVPHRIIISGRYL